MNGKDTRTQNHRHPSGRRGSRLAATLTLSTLLATACGGEDRAGVGDEDGSQPPPVEEVAVPEDPSSNGGEPSGALSGGAWIEYTVSGDASAQLREPDVMICGRGDDDVLLARSLGAWVVDIETESSGWGEISARFTLSAPSELEGLDSPGRDPRFRGSGRVVLEDKGRDRFGMPDVEGTFEALGLTSHGGHTLNVSGTFRCGVM